MSETLEMGDLQGKREEFFHFLQEMRKLRYLSKCRELHPQEKNEYLLLTTHLGSWLKSEESAQKDVVHLKEMLEQDYSLTQYDFTHDMFWRAVEPGFTNTLDHLLISLTQDEFASLEDKHHLWNAVSWLWGKEKPIREYVELCDTLLSQTEVDLDVLYPTHLKKEGVLHVKGKGYVASTPSQESLERLSYLLKKSNSCELSFIADRKSQEYLKKEFPKASTLTLEDETLKEVGLAPSWKWLRNQGKIAKDITYYFLGQTSRYTTGQLQRWNGVEHFNQERSVRAPISTNRNAGFIGLMGSGFGGAAQMLWNGFFNESSPLEIPGLLPVGLASAGLLVVAAAQIWAFTVNTANSKSGGGSIPGLILGLPLSLYFRKKGSELSSLRLLTIPKQNVKESSSSLSQSYHPAMEVMAEHQISKEVEDNLVWTLENHHTQGKVYAEKLQSAQKSPPYFGKNYRITPGLNTLTFYELGHHNPYTKVSALICQKGERWATTFITKKEGAGNIDVLNEWASIHQKIEESHVQELSKKVGAEYFHLTQFVEGKKMGDYRVVV